MYLLSLRLMVTVLGLVVALPVQADITRLVVEHRLPIGSNGYEELSGRAYGEVNPRHPLNGIITDLELAPRNSQGSVEYVSTFTILKPVDMSQASGVLLYVVPNRGRVNLRSGGFFEDARRQGHVLVASGWQADLAPVEGLETLEVPVARHADGSTITGPVLARFVDMPPDTMTLPILRGRMVGTAEPASLDTSLATLTRRASEGGVVIPIHSDAWAFADCGSRVFPGLPDPRKVCVAGGFDPGYLYELVYTAKDPKVHGIGFAATRDLVAYLRHGRGNDPEGDHILQRKITATVSQGNSQSGTFLRSFIHLGFNQDEAGRIVFDGSNPHIAARLLAMNVRFAAPSGAAGMYEPGSDGIVWWSSYIDEARSLGKGSLLGRCMSTGTCPKIVETFGSAEFYNLRASPMLVGTGAKFDIPLPSNVRRYYFPGVRHGGGQGGFDTTLDRDDCCELLPNPNPSRYAMRALRTALIEWVVKGTQPPPSQYPRLDRGELSSPTRLTLGFPTIPGVPLPDGVLVPLFEYDYGKEFDYQDLSGVITIQPPPVRQVLPTLVPTVDADGNETSGVASVLHQVPLGTYTGWNTIRQGFYKGEIRRNAGGYIPFARTRAERLVKGDPRPSLEERYGSHENYVAHVRVAAERLVKGRYLLQDDAERLINEAEASLVLK